MISPFYGLKTESTTDIGDKIIQARNRYRQIIIARYRELLPTLITYQTNIRNCNIDFFYLEFLLRAGYNVALGKDNNDKLQILGVIKTQDKRDFLQDNYLTEKDIEFIIPKQYREEKYRCITREDGCSTGNFIVLRNKLFSEISDFTILDHYADILTEIVVSRFSIIIQLKVATILRGEVGDETINQLANDIYNGKPFIKTSLAFDPEEALITFENGGLSASLVELKKEYNNILCELNTMLGIDSTFSDKESGVSEIELTANNGFKSANSNIYLAEREKELEKLFLRYDIKITCQYNNLVAGELESILIKEESEENKYEDDHEII